MTSMSTERKTMLLYLIQYNYCIYSNVITSHKNKPKIFFVSTNIVTFTNLVLQHINNFNGLNNKNNKRKSTATIQKKKIWFAAYPTSNLSGLWCWYADGECYSFHHIYSVWWCEMAEWVNFKRHSVAAHTQILKKTNDQTNNPSWTWTKWKKKGKESWSERERGRKMIAS